MAVNELPTITVHTDERQPIEFLPATHGVSKPVELSDEKKIFYVAPLHELEWLSGEAPPPENKE